MMTFNAADGFVEAEVRGYRGGILRAQDYANFSQCETLDDMKLHFPSTDYGDFLQNEPSPMQHTSVIHDRCTEKLVREFQHIRSEVVEPLATFLDYITYGYMIDNVILLVTGTLHRRDATELVKRCHPLGLFESLGTLTVASTVAELYNLVLIDTPLAPYFQSCLKQEDLNEVNIEIIRNKLWKAYLEDFYEFCQELGGATAIVMGNILSFEAGRRSINITINSFGTELQKDDRQALYPAFGMLHPEGTDRLAKADDIEQVRAAVDYCAPFRKVFAESGGDRSLENAFFAAEVELHVLSFCEQMQYGVFYSWIRLKEQEIRNLLWIAECIAQQRKGKINQIIPIFN
jgi:V-type H+-transporting ATPase subunit d